MISTHYKYLPPNVDWHTVVDDFGNEQRPFEYKPAKCLDAWQSAYRFANGQSFEQAGMQSIGCLVEEH